MSDLWRESVDLARERLKWAITRITEFHGEAQSFLDSGPYEIHAEFYDDEKGDDFARVSCKLVVRKQTPIGLRLRAGEIINNLRAAVDNLLWGAGQRFDAGDRLSLMYANSPAHFQTMSYYKKVGNLPTELRDWLEGEQPYPGRDKRPLWHLTQLWNEDKHRLPSLMATAAPNIGFTPDKGPVTMMGPSSKQLGLKDGDEVFGCTLPREHIVNFNPQFTMNIGFAEVPTVDATNYMAGLEGHIRLEVIPKFEPFLV